MFITGLKKTANDVDNSPKVFELDELYWFINKKESSKTKENVYIITMISREPRQIISFDVALDKTSKRIQKIIDSGPEAEKYCTDGYFGYLDVVFPGEHIRNVHNKKDTYTVEGINADLRHYIPLLRRRSRCFARSIDTLSAVLDVFVEAYNRFGLAKFKYRQAHPSRSFPLGFVDFLFER
jgi:IS1 family transposase